MALVRMSSPAQAVSPRCPHSTDENGAEVFCAVFCTFCLLSPFSPVRANSIWRQGSRCRTGMRPAAEWSQGSESTPFSSGRICLRAPIGGQRAQLQTVGPLPAGRADSIALNRERHAGSLRPRRLKLRGPDRNRAGGSSMPLLTTGRGRALEVPPARRLGLAWLRRPAFRTQPSTDAAAYSRSCLLPAAAPERRLLPRKGRITCEKELPGAGAGASLPQHRKALERAGAGVENRRQEKGYPVYLTILANLVASGEITVKKHRFAVPAKNRSKAIGRRLSRSTKPLALPASRERTPTSLFPDGI